MICHLVDTMLLLEINKVTWWFSVQVDLQDAVAVTMLRL